VGAVAGQPAAEQGTRPREVGMMAETKVMISGEPVEEKLCDSWQVAKVKCGNCGAGHIATFPACAARPMECHECHEMACRVTRYY